MVYRKILAGCLIFNLVFLSQVFASPVSAKIIDGTRVPWSNFPSVAYVQVANSSCTGTLITSRHVLTAAHCFFDENHQRTVGNQGTVVYFGNSGYESSKVTIHSTYNPANVCASGEIDAAIVELSESVSGISPSTFTRSAPTVGQTLTMVGYGLEGEGQYGQDPNSFPPDGYVNTGYTTIEGYDSNYVGWEFDTGESNTASGDSGGPAFVTQNGQSVINSIVCGGTQNAEWGSASWNTRVDTIASWIDSVTGSAPPTLPGSGPGTATISISKANIRFPSLQSWNNSFQLKGHITLPSGFVVKGKTFSFTIGGFTRNFKLDAWGEAGTDYNYLVVKKKPRSGTFNHPFELWLTQGRLFKELVSLGINPATVAAQGESISLPVSLVASGMSTSATVTVTLSGKRWK